MHCSVWSIFGGASGIEDSVAKGVRVERDDALIWIALLWWRVGWSSVTWIEPNSNRLNDGGALVDHEILACLTVMVIKVCGDDLAHHTRSAVSALSCPIGILRNMSDQGSCVSEWTVSRIQETHIAVVSAILVGIDAD